MVRAATFFGTDLAALFGTGCLWFLIGADRGSGSFLRLVPVVRKQRDPGGATAESRRLDVSRRGG